MSAPVLLHNTGLMPYRLIFAIALSLALHAGLLFPDVFKRLSAPPPRNALVARLRLPAEPAPPPEPLVKNTLDANEEPKPVPAPPPPSAAPKKDARPKTANKRETQVAQRKLAQHLYYPPEALAKGIEGEVRLIVRLDANGAVEDVAIAASSGHAILDNAAIRAAYAMGHLGGGSSRELILPVIFRLQ